MGSDLYEQVFYSLDLIEKDYFGLQFTDANNVQHWLDATKAVKKQVKSEFLQPLATTNNTVINPPPLRSWPPVHASPESEVLLARAKHFARGIDALPVLPATKTGPAGRSPRVRPEQGHRIVRLSAAM